MYKWTRAVQTCAVQGSTARIFLTPLHSRHCSATCFLLLLVCFPPKMSWRSFYNIMEKFFFIPSHAELEFDSILLLALCQLCSIDEGCISQVAARNRWHFKMSNLISESRDCSYRCGPHGGKAQRWCRFSGPANARGLRGKGRSGFSNQRGVFWQEPGPGAEEHSQSLLIPRDELGEQILQPHSSFFHYPTSHWCSPLTNPKWQQRPWETTASGPPLSPRADRNGGEWIWGTNRT